MNAPALWALCIAGAYLAGSIPFGLLLGFTRGVDLRRHGSKNIGATNAGRVLGRGWGYLCFGLDVMKGAAPVALAGWITGAMSVPPIEARTAWLWIAVACAAVFGHMHSIFIGFKGGKGVATGFGVLLGLVGSLTWPALIALAVWLVVVRITRYVSVASCISAVTIPLSTLAFAMARSAERGLSPGESVREVWPFLTMTIGLALLVIWKHRANITRLRAGAEPKIGRRGMAPRTRSP